MWFKCNQFLLQGQAAAIEKATMLDSSTEEGLSAIFRSIYSWDFGSPTQEENLPT